MPHSHYIRTMLDLKDKNITFLQSFCKETKIKGILSKVFYGILSYTPHRCVNCGMENEEMSIIKYGFKTSRLTLNSTSHYPTYLLLKNNAFIVKNVRLLSVQKQMRWTVIASFLTRLNNPSRLNLQIKFQRKI